LPHRSKNRPCSALPRRSKNLPHPARHRLRLARRRRFLRPCPGFRSSPDFHRNSPIRPLRRARWCPQGGCLTTYTKPPSRKRERRSRVLSAIACCSLGCRPCRAPRCSSAYHTLSPTPVAHLMCRIFRAIRQATLHHASASIKKR
jgi:hypothetical protein